MIITSHLCFCVYCLWTKGKQLKKMDEILDISRFLLNMNLKKNAQYLETFDSLTNLERVNFVYKDLREHCPEYPIFSNDEKSDEKSVLIRRTGNTRFRLAKYEEALKHYTVCIQTAKSNGVLSVAYANRSAALFRLDRYKECLMDIERALQHDYPDHLKPKVLERQRQAKALEARPIAPMGQKYYEEVPKIPQSKKNPLIECAADNVKIVKTQQYGRAVMATRDIQIGEIIAIEKPYAAVEENQYHLHCHECIELCYNLIPCNTCSEALYCSVKCRDQAFKYHQYECPIQHSLDLICRHVVYVQPLPIRVALKIIFLSKNELDKFHNYEIEENEIYRSDRFKEVYNMEPWIMKRLDMNLFRWTVLTAGIFRLIKNHTSFLQDGVNEDCLKHLILTLIPICYAHTIGIEELIPDLTPSNFKYSGIGVYPFSTLLNHSCNPNIIRCFHGNTMVMRAISTIKEGEQCFVCYGPVRNYWRRPKEYRQNFLAENYFFKCTCRACEENWPMKNFPDIEKEWPHDWFLMTELSCADPDYVEDHLPWVLSRAKKLERDLPPGRDYAAKENLAFCYYVFGNKMRVDHFSD